MLDLTDNKGRKDIKSMTLEEVTEEMAALGEKSFRAKQIYDWIHVKLAGSFDQMSSLSKELRQKLKDNYSLTCLSITDERISRIDGTRKFLFCLEDGNIIESVWMQYHHGNSVCISSQVGCRMGCRFCASTLDGLEPVSYTHLDTCYLTRVAAHFYSACIRAGEGGCYEVV